MSEPFVTIKSDMPGPESATVSERRSLEEAIRYHVRFSLAKDWSDLSKDDLFHAVSLAVKELAVDRMLRSERLYRERDVKRVYYLSMEFLVGRTLGNNLVNLGLFEECRQALQNLGADLDEIMAEETDPALGNGGLGRLAACFLDSLATLGMPGFGYGINYEFGLFRQAIENGYQREKPDRWLSDGLYWQIHRPEKSVQVPIYGRVVSGSDVRGADTWRWVDAKTIQGVPHDMPIVGYGGKTVNFLRLYSARASDDFNINIFNQGDYIKAVEEKIMSETVSKALYPADSGPAGKELRLIQEYFFVSCALRDIIRRYLSGHEGFDQFSSKVAIQMNDTHPAIAVADLMHLLMDEHGLEWEKAWEITTATFGFTNHTLLPEALEKWPAPLLERLLPRHLQIIYRINDVFLEQVTARWPGDAARSARMSIVEEGTPKHIRMAHLSIVGSHSVNGVAALHSELVKTRLVPDFHEMWPARFNNKTNGVTPRRWILKANPQLADLITRSIGAGWITDLDQLRGLERFADDEAFRAAFATIKGENKARFAKFVRDTLGIYVAPESMVDVQIKRMHLYKRQFLNVLQIIHAYLSVVEDRQTPAAPQTFVFAGKAAPGYWAAKQVIKLIHNVAGVINQDPRTRDWLTVVFVPDYRVTIAEMLIPAADLSEQISTAGMEASGTGNMKFAMNGALTIGTMDGANIEIRQNVGEDNIFIFGLRAEEVRALKESRSYSPAGIVERSPTVARVVDAIRQDRFSAHEPGIFRELVHMLMDPNDPFLHLADLESYIAAHASAVSLFPQKDQWMQKAILNVARTGFFSSDRTIREYAADVWGITPALPEPSA